MAPPDSMARQGGKTLWVKGVLPPLLTAFRYDLFGPSKQPKGLNMKYLSFSELRAKLGGRGRTTVYRDIEEGRLPQPIKLGGRLYWVESDVDEAMASMQQKT